MFFRHVWLVGVLVSLVFALACDSNSTGDAVDYIGMSDSAISGCEGFAGAEKRATDDIPFTVDQKTYHDAERLHWRFDGESGILSFLNARVVLNCCGDHTVTASGDEGSILIAEKDQPEDGTRRCKCICPFDFFVEVDGMSPRTVDVTLRITVDDSTWTKWNGEIDLAAGSGELIVDSTAYNK